MTDENICLTCIYYRLSEEYWHDHYLIPEHHCCIYKSKYDPKDIDPYSCCENYQSKAKEKSE